MLGNGGGEDEKFPKEPGGERHTGQRDHRDQHGEREKGRALGQSIEVCDFFAGLLSNNDQNSEAKKCHQQVSYEIKRHGGAVDARDADEEIARVSKSRVSEKPFEIVLRKRRQISVEDREQRDQNNEAFHS